jgi:transcriptional regulator with XRE-family HTH domain
MELNEIIRIYRLRNNLKQSEVAEILNLKTSAYSNIENAKTELTVERLIKMFPILGDEFFNDVMIYIHEKSIAEVGKQIGEENMKPMKKAEDFTEEQTKSILKKSLNYRKSIFKTLVNGY